MKQFLMLRVFGPKSKTTVESVQEPSIVYRKPRRSNLVEKQLRALEEADVNSNPSEKQIRALEEADMNRYYCCARRLCASAHPGMDIVYARRRSDDVEVVVKSIQKSIGFEDAGEDKLWRETTKYFLNLPRSDGLCEVLDAIATRKNYYVVMEKCEGRNIYEQMVSEGISADGGRDIARQLIGALDVLHSTGRVHRDLKLKNAVVNVSGKSGITTKLIDFDTVVPFGPGSSKPRLVVGTDGYIAPEGYDGNYSPASDIYSAGVMIYRILTKRSPMSLNIFDDQPGENYVGHSSMKRIKEHLRTARINFKLSPLDRLSEASELVESMLAFEPTDRPSAAQALNHKWFTEGDSIGKLRGGLSSMTIRGGLSTMSTDFSTADTLPSYVGDDGDTFNDGLSDIDSESDDEISLHIS